LDRLPGGKLVPKKR